MHDIDPPVDQQMLARIRAGYLEMPGLTLTAEQVQRLCGVERATCRMVLAALVDANFLCVKRGDTYARPTEGASLRPQPVKAELHPRGLTTRGRTTSRVA